MDYHGLSGKEVVEQLGSDINGLNSGQVVEGLRKFGKNKLKKTKHFNALKVFLSQFKSFLIIILIFAAILSVFMKSVIDSIVIFVVIIINASLGFSQEYKAERAIENLKKMMVNEANVLRNGRRLKINAEEIVPGDILILRAGDRIMADARILESEELKVNEAPLTGESVPVEKISEKLKSSVVLAERINMVYQGTQVVAGNAEVIVISTGMSTELGKISGLVQEIKSGKNPFRDKLDVFAKKLGIFTLLLCALIVWLLVNDGVDIFQSFLVAISLAVSAIPEGLPAVISLGLAFATRRMIRKNVLIRKLPASETLGRVTIICVDKTGTLTEEKMSVSSIYTNGKINPAKNNDLLFKIGILCNKARIEKDEKGGEYLLGDPTEKALIVSAKNNFLDKRELTAQEPKLKEFPFNSKRKMMSVIRKVNGKSISYVKGAPERIVNNSSYELIEGRAVKLNDSSKQKLLEVYEDMAKQGLRVLGFAYKSVNEISLENAENELIFVGFQGMIDPPRPEVKNAIRLANNAGIKVLMMTGDSQLTANAVAKQIGLKGKSVDAKMLQKITDRQLFDNIDDIAVFSRISPEDKLRIINILKQKKEIVAMTGDGVNDALALKRADIGIAMGIRGTDVARDSSDMVLIDDNFSSIVEGVKEGRRIYDNVKKSVKFLLSVNFSEVVLVFLVMLIWRDPKFLPLLPLQILWINLTTDSLPALALSSEPMEKDVMQKRPSRKGILNGIKLFILVASLFPLLVYFLFFWLNMDNMDLARTMIVTFSVVFQMFLVFNCKSDKSIFKSGMNKYLVYAVLVSIILHLIALYTPVSKLFYFVSLGVYDWVKIISLGALGFVLIEGFKFFERKRAVSA